MLKFNEKTMKKAVVAEEFAIEDEHFCISSIERSDSVVAKCGMEVWVFNEADCDSYGSREMCLCWLPKFGFATAVASNLIDLIPTESPEEKEALDMIDTTSKQVESLANDSELPNSSKYDRTVGGPVKLSPPEWNGDGLPYAGVECEFKKYYQDKSEFVKCFIVGETKDKEWLVVHDYADDQLHFANKRTSSFEFRPIESPEQKAERERLEAIETMCGEVGKLPHGEAFAAMAMLYDLGYRKVKQ